MRLIDNRTGREISQGDPIRHLVPGAGSLCFRGVKDGRVRAEDDPSGRPWMQPRMWLLAASAVGCRVEG